MLREALALSRFDVRRGCSLIFVTKPDEERRSKRLIFMAHSLYQSYLALKNVSHNYVKDEKRQKSKIKIKAGVGYTIKQNLTPIEYRNKGHLGNYSAARTTVLISALST